MSVEMTTDGEKHGRGKKCLYQLKVTHEESGFKGHQLYSACFWSCSSCNVAVCYITAEQILALHIEPKKDGHTPKSSYKSKNNINS